MVAGNLAEAKAGTVHGRQGTDGALESVADSAAEDQCVTSCHLALLRSYARLVRPPH